jgi:hypothetical protein
MNIKLVSVPYRLNLIRTIRERERKSERRKRMAFILGAGCFGFLIISGLYSAMTIWLMENVIKSEQDKLSRLQQEYQKYTATKLIIDKTDVELLGNLQGTGIFWTRKLAAMAKHLPDNYWITHFSFHENELRVSGFGIGSPQQRQLLILDGYIRELRNDSSFADVFKSIRLRSADRNEEGGRVAFEFSAYTAKWKSQ